MQPTNGACLYEANRICYADIPDTIWYRNPLNQPRFLLFARDRKHNF